MKRAAALTLMTSAAPISMAAAGVCASYAADLAVMTSVDQALRARWDFSAPPADAGSPAELPRIVQQTELVDRTNTTRLKALVRACGWPRRSVHGEQAVQNAWLLAQHADHDRRFQRLVLSLLETGVTAGEVPPENLAYLADRLAVADGKPQRWGTQLTQTGPCGFDFSPLDNRARVEERRKAIGLPPLEDYRQLVNDTAARPGCNDK
jgi:hypothetical protein